MVVFTVWLLYRSKVGKKTQICLLRKACYLSIAIRPSNTMISGFWVTYGCMQDMGCNVLTVNHKYEFVASVPWAFTQKMENLQQNAKLRSKKQHGSNRTMLDSNLSERMSWQQHRITIRLTKSLLTLLLCFDLCKYQWSYIIHAFFISDAFFQPSLSFVYIFKCQLLLNRCLLHIDMILPRYATFCIFVSISTSKHGSMIEKEMQILLLSEISIYLS